MQPTPASWKQHAVASPIDRENSAGAARPIEVVIPFTSLKQVQVGLRLAEQLCSGLHAALRVVRVLIVPFPLDLDRPDVPVSSIVAEMQRLSCDLPLTLDVRLSRERVPALVEAIPAKPLMLLASKRRLWRTKEEKLANELKRAGYEVLVRYEGLTNA